MAMQLTMPITEDLLKERKQILKLKRQHLEIINKDRERLIYEIEALRVEVGEPDQVAERNKAEMEKLEAEIRGDDQC